MGICMHWMALEQAVDDIKPTSVVIWCDNILAISWVCKFWTSTSLIASNILKALATQIHVCQAGLLAIDHISGVFNVMADVALKNIPQILTHSPSPFLVLSPYHRKPHEHCSNSTTSSNLSSFPLYVKSTWNGVVASTIRERLRFLSAWKKTWLAFNFPTVHPNLQQINRSNHIELLAAFAHHVRSGGISTRTHKVRTQTVQVALWAISTTI